MLIFCLFLGASFAWSQRTNIQISAKNNTEPEQKVASLLKEVLSDYDLTRWNFTDKVVIQDRVIPHSHPVLTLNTSSMEKKDILDTYVHEQIHWYVDKFPDAEKKSIEEFKTRYKDVPFGNRAGASDEYSTYLHLIVCYLEYRSLAELLNEDEAKQIMWNQTHYTWVYNKIIEDREYIGKVLRENDFKLVE